MGALIFSLYSRGFFWLCRFSEIDRGLELLDYWWYICSCSDRQGDHCHGLVDNTSRVKDDLSLCADTVLSAMVLTIANRSRSKSHS